MNDILSVVVFSIHDLALQEEFDFLYYLFVPH